MKKMKSPKVRPQTATASQKKLTAGGDMFLGTARIDVINETEKEAGEI